MNLESMALPKKREVFGPVSYQLAPGGIVGLHTILRQEAFDSGFVAVTNLICWEFEEPRATPFPCTSR